VFGTCRNTPGAFECLCSEGRSGESCRTTDQCQGVTVCSETYPCVEENPPRFYHCAAQFAEWPLTHVAARFSASGGVVSDAMTGLQWQQVSYTSTSTCGEDLACALFKSTCSNSFACTWAEAKQYCSELGASGAGLGEGWRLPSRIELLSIVDPTRANPAVDPAAFPDTVSEAYWSSSPLVGSLTHAWGVYFSIGYSNYYDTTSYAGLVRCVR
jgi:hypothetical protein